MTTVDFVDEVVCLMIPYEEASVARVQAEMDRIFG
jgi:hypothetical protein